MTGATPPGPLIDTHAHFDNFQEPGERAAVLDRAAAAGIRRAVAIGGRVEANELACSFALEFPGRVSAAVGYDRDQAPLNPPLEVLRSQVIRSGVVAVGEIGLDYHYEPGTAAAQRELMGRMLELAREHRLPAVIHSREADADTLALLQEHARHWPEPARAPGVLHCFTGDRGFAARLLDLGFCISFSGIITFRNADALREVARMVPEERLLIETDSPYLAPVPHRGRRNEPAFLVHVAEALAKIRNDTVEHIAHITTRNAGSLFGLNTEDTP